MTATAVSAPATPHSAPPTTAPKSPWADLPAAATVAVFTLVVSLAPFPFNPQFYFFADTPDGAYGQWYELGQQLRAGVWPLMNPDAWMAGNYVAEGQWGLWNPLVMMIGVLVSLSSSAVLAASVIKIAFLVIGAVGVYAVTRVYGGGRPWAVLAGAAAPFAGFTFFMDAPSWVTNLFTWALFAWAVVAIKLWMHRGRWWIIAAFAASYLLVTIGYVQGTLMLVFFFVSLLVEAAIRRDGRWAIRALLAGIPAGLVAIAVYLPGLLTASVTARSSEIQNDGFLVVTLTGLATSTVPSGEVDLAGWWGRFTDVPLLYIAWFLPLLALVDWRRIADRWRGAISLGVFGGLAVALAVGPSLLGALRFPARTMPWIALVVIVLTCLALSWTAQDWRVTKGRVLLLGALWAVPYWLAWSQMPQGLRRHAMFATLSAAALAAMLVLIRRRRNAGRAIVAIGVATTALFTVLQSAVFADSLVSRVDYSDDASSYTDGMPTGYGGGIVIGSVLDLPPEALNEVEFANMWYLTDRVETLNLYTPVEYRAMAQDLCLAYDGRTCPDAVDRLFEPDETTDAPLADLMSLDSVQLLTDEETSIRALAQRTPPVGWSQSFVGDYSVVWTRGTPTEDAGSVTWTSPGTAVSVIDSGPLSTTFRIDSVPESGGKVVLSRLAWPGYGVSGGSLADPLRDYLLTVDIDADTTDQIVTVTFRPPGWPLVVGSLVSAVILTLGIAITPSLIRRYSRPPADHSGV